MVGIVEIVEVREVEVVGLVEEVVGDGKISDAG